MLGVLVENWYQCRMNWRAVEVLAREDIKTCTVPPDFLDSQVTEGTLGHKESGEASQAVFIDSFSTKFILPSTQLKNIC